MIVAIYSIVEFNLESSREKERGCADQHNMTPKLTFPRTLCKNAKMQLRQKMQTCNSDKKRKNATFQWAYFASTGFQSLSFCVRLWKYSPLTTASFIISTQCLQNTAKTCASFNIELCPCLTTHFNYLKIPLYKTYFTLQVGKHECWLVVIHGWTFLYTWYLSIQTCKTVIPEFVTGTTGGTWEIPEKYEICPH